MTKQETAKLMTVMTATYSNLHFQDAELALETWWRILEVDDAGLIMDAFYRYARTDTSGFAPTPGKLHMMIAERLTAPDQLSDGEILDILTMASRNANYGFEEEFQRMPLLLQKAVGSPSVVRTWGMMDQDSLEFTHSRILNAYRTILSREKIDRALEGFKKSDAPRVSGRDWDLIAEAEEEDDDEEEEEFEYHELTRNW